jgi:hypothetical protein
MCRLDELLRDQLQLQSGVGTGRVNSTASEVILLETVETTSDAPAPPDVARDIRRRRADGKPQSEGLLADERERDHAAGS